MAIAKPNTDGNNFEFDKAYWASKDPECHKLAQMDLSEWAGMHKSIVLADSLAGRGVQIDVPIMVWQQDPFKVMEQRLAYGYTWVPAARQPNTAVAPGVTQPGTAPYDPDHLPPGAIKVSLDFDDYPPFQG